MIQTDASEIGLKELNEPAYVYCSDLPVNTIFFLTPRHVLIQGECCSDGKHCCDYGYKCDSTSMMCKQGFSEIPAGTQERAKSN